MSVYVASTEAPDKLQGVIDARVEQPFERARAALATADAWCAILILHLNVKYCRAEHADSGDVLQVAIGRKFDQPQTGAQWVRFAFRVVHVAPDDLQLALEASSGPLGIHDYRIALELAAADDGRTLLHLTYSYGYGIAARWAMQAYLNTLARDKVGFSVVGRRGDGRPIFVGGLRGVIERNAMRYCLAITSVLGAQPLPASNRVARSLENWFDATERYPMQLHEIDRADYLAMKRREIEREATVSPPLRPK